MRCPNCQAGNSEGDNFCAFCGEPLTSLENQAEPRQELTPVGVSSIESLEQMEGQVVDKPQDQLSEAPPKKRSFKVVLLVLLCLIVIAGGGIFAYTRWMVPPKTPEEQLVDGLIDFFEAESGEVHTTIKIKDLQMDMDVYDSAMLQDLLSDMVIESVIRYDGPEKKVEGELALELLGTTLLTVGYYLDRDYLVLDIPLLYDQVMTIQIDDLVVLLQDVYDPDLLTGLGTFGLIPDPPVVELPETDEGLDVRKLKDSILSYLDLMSKDNYPSYKLIDQEPYKEMMIPFLVEVIHLVEEGSYTVNYDSSIGYEGLRYSIEYDQEEGDMLVEDMMDYMSTDPLVHDYIEEIITVLFDRVIANQDYTMYAILKEKPLSEVTTWEGALYAAELELLKQETIDEVMDGLMNVQTELDQAKEEAAASMDVNVDNFLDASQLKMRIDLDDEGTIRAAIADVVINLSEEDESPISISVEVTNDFITKEMGITFKGPQVEGGIDVGAMNEEELEVFMMEVQTNLFQKIAENPMFGDLFNFGF